MESSPLLLDPSKVAAELVGPPAPPPAAESVPFPSEPVVLRDKRPFDPAKFKSNPDGSPRLNRLGFFMPIGGRKPQTAANPAPAPAVAPAPLEVLEPEKPAWSAADRAEASGEPLPPPPAPEASANAASSSGPTGAAAAPAGVDVSEDAAEVATKTLYYTAGLLFGSLEEATPDKAEHENLRSATAAWIRTTGWKGTALTCIFLRVCAYILKTANKPTGAATVKTWLANLKAKKKAPVPVQASSPAVDAPPPRRSNGFPFSERPAA